MVVVRLLHHSAENSERLSEADYRRVNRDADRGFEISRLQANLWLEWLALTVGTSTVGSLVHPLGSHRLSICWLITDCSCHASSRVDQEFPDTGYDYRPRAGSAAKLSAGASTLAGGRALAPQKSTDCPYAKVYGDDSSAPYTGLSRTLVTDMIGDRPFYLATR